MAVEFDFVKSVLGDQAAEVLDRAVKKSEDLGRVLVPRTILAWLNSCADTFEGALPGTTNTYVKFVKTESGYCGSITIGQELYPLTNASVFEAVAAIASSLDLAPQSPPKVRNLDLEKLGKSIDLMAKTQRLKDEVAKAPKPCPHCKGNVRWESESRVAFHLSEGKMCQGVKKGENFGPAAAPEKLRPEPPQQVSPEAPAPAKPRRPKPPKLGSPKVVHLDKSEASVPCTACGQMQFKEQEFRGCICLRELAKDAKVLEYGDRITLSLESDEWDADAILTLFDSVGRNG